MISLDRIRHRSYTKRSSCGNTKYKNKIKTTQIVRTTLTLPLSIAQESHELSASPLVRCKVTTQGELIGARVVEKTINPDDGQRVDGLLNSMRHAFEMLSPATARAA